jgi:hypothetical protein
VILSELESTLTDLGIRLSARLVVDAPLGALTPDLVDALAAHKPALLARLAEAQGSDRPRWADLSRWRWSPNVGDPEPGLRVDRPDPESLVERLARVFAEAAADPYAVAERDAIQCEGELGGAFESNQGGINIPVPDNELSGGGMAAIHPTPQSAP